MKYSSLLVATLLLQNAYASNEGYVLGSTIWKDSSIPVCWESHQDSSASERTWVRNAVARTWEEESQVKFTGWGECSVNSEGIRIEIADDNPHVDRLGNLLDGRRNGMSLNFTFQNWGTSCETNENGRRQFCIEIIAVHEFGHALGFAHEQNRPDTPDTCDEPQGTDGDIIVGEWDLESVMNYCNPKWNGDGKLSKTDIDMVRRFYGSKFEDDYLIGDWDGDGKDNIAIRRGSRILMDTNFDGAHDLEQSFGKGNDEDEYLVGDWDGDGRDNIAIRRGSRILMDTNFDGAHDIEQSFGNGNDEAQYLVGDWDGDGRDNIAVRRWNRVLMDTNFDGAADMTQTYGDGNNEDEYMVGDWDGDGQDNIAVRRNNQLFTVTDGCLHSS